MSANVQQRPADRPFPALQHGPLLRLSGKESELIRRARQGSHLNAMTAPLCRQWGERFAQLPHEHRQDRHYRRAVTRRASRIFPPDLAVRKQGPLSFFAVATLTDAALAQCRAGHNREGESNARKAYETSTKAFGPSAALTGATAYTLASCLISLSKQDEASPLLQQIDVPAITQLTGDPDWGANVTLAQAQIAYSHRNYDAARTYIQSVTPIYTRKNAEPYQKRAFESLKAALEKSLLHNPVS